MTATSVTSEMTVATVVIGETEETIVAKSQPKILTNLGVAEGNSYPLTMGIPTPNPQARCKQTAPKKTDIF